MMLFFKYLRCFARRFAGAGQGGGRPAAPRKRSGFRRMAWVSLMAGLGLGCRDEVATPVASPALLSSGADQVMTGFELFLTFQGVREGVVRGDTAFLYRDSSMVVLVNPTLELFDQAGGVRATVTARKGRYHTVSRGMSAFGEVVLVIPEGDRRVEGPELHYDPAGDRIWSDSLTTMREGAVVSQGLGFTSDLQFRQMRVGPGSIRGGGGGRIRF